MKKLLNVLMITLALNFIALVAGVGYLFKTGALSREKVASIKTILHPATTQAADDDKKDQPQASTQPTMKLDALLARVSGRPAGEQVDFIQRTFDAQMVQLDRRLQEVQAREDALAKAQKALDDDRAKIAVQQKKQDERDSAQTRQAQDKGFADSLALYDSMSARQVKDVFTGLDDATVTRYLRAMEPARAAKILKEFKGPGETERVQRLIESIRGQPQPQAAGAG
jgi:hypothetical protein